MMKHIVLFILSCDLYRHEPFII